MTVTGPASHDGEPSAAALLAAGDITGLMRACHDRRLEREGIPMVLGLADERRPLPANTDAAQLAEGAAFAAVLDRYADALVPFAERLPSVALSSGTCVRSSTTAGCPKCAAPFKVVAGRCCGLV